MRRGSILVIVLALAAAGCGARTELDVSGGGPGGGGGGPTRSYSRIGIFGTEGAFDESPLLAFLRERHVVTRTQTDGAPLTAEALDAFDLVILDELGRDYTPDEARAFERWVDAGGGVISLTGYLNAESDTERPNSLVENLGVSYRQPLLSPAFNGEVTTFAKHPLTKGLTGVPFFGGYEVTHDAPATEVAFDMGTTVGVAREHGSGRVYLWGDEWVAYKMEWTSPQPRRFWSDAMAWLSHED